MVKADKMGELNYSVRTKAVIEKICTGLINRIRPLPALATVQSVDRVAMTASVLMQSDTAAVTIPISPGSAPFDAGDIVQVSRTLGSLRATSVVSSPSYPGGTIMSPAVVNPTFLSGNDKRYKIWSRESIDSVLTDPIASLLFGQAWYIGRWTSRNVNPDAKLTDTFKVAAGDCYFSFDCVPHASPAGYPNGVWRTVEPDASLACTSPSQFNLEVLTDFDADGYAFIEMRLRHTFKDTVGNTIAMLPGADVEIHGAWLRDPNFPSAYDTTSVAATTTYPSGHDTGIITGPTTIYGAINIGVPKGVGVHTVTAYQIRRVGKTVTAWINITTGAAISGGTTTGDIGNVSVAQLPPEFAPCVTHPMSSAGIGVLIAAICNSAGLVQITAMIPNTTIASGSALSMAGTWLAA